MKILAMTHNFPNEGNPNHGIFAARQLAEMKRRGAEITVLVPIVWRPPLLGHFRRWAIYDHRWTHQYRDIQAVTVPYLRPPGAWFLSWEAYAVYLAARPVALQLHRAKQFDVIYARFLHPEGYAAVKLSKLMGIPVIGVGAGDEVNIYPNRSERFRRGLIHVLESLDGALASGRAVADRIAEMTGKTAMPVHGVVDLDVYAPTDNKTSVRRSLGLPSDAFIVLYVGTFKAAKGVYEMIEAFARVQRRVSGILMKICGYGREEPRMLRFIEECDAQATIHIVGEVHHDKVHRWMQACDLFVLASHMEGMPNVVMEAMACGMPVVSTTVGGLPSEVGDCSGVILVPPKDVSALERAMLKIISDRELQNLMSAAARKRAAERFGVQRNAETILTLVHRIVEERRGYRSP
jgi:glycosyltransferase involved in cell wall biosynthesis